MPISSEVANSELSLNAQVAIDDICDAFEADLRGGGEPHIEDFLADTPVSCRPNLLHELLRIEREYREKRADADYRRRFPDYARRPETPSVVAAGANPTSDMTVDLCDNDRQRGDAFPNIPGYTILSKLGEGGMGLVYQARQLKLDRIVALKMMRAGQFASPVERQRFRFEAEAIAALDHPNIAPVYDVGDIGGASYLCLKYLEQGSLAERLKARRYPPKEAAALMGVISLAVQHAHDRGVLHRDLKPANILLDGEGRPHVADFGLARRVSAEHSLTPTGAVIGTLNYMAPEQARGERSVAVTADIYALGAILYELLTGAPPIKGKTALETLTLLTEGCAVVPPRQLNRAVPADLDAICLKCLERDPVHRYASAAALADDLNRFVNHEPVSVQPPGVWDWFVQAMRTRSQPSPNYTWLAPVWLGILTFVQHAAIFALVETNQPAWFLWTVVLVGWCSCALVIWFLLLRRFRFVPGAERHSVLVAIGSLTAQIMLLLSMGPVNLYASSRGILLLYPPLTVMAGLCFFILGSTHWGRFIPIGLMVMGLAPVIAVWPEIGPPVYAVVGSLLLVWWGLAIRWYFLPDKESLASAPTVSK